MLIFLALVGTLLGWWDIPAWVFVVLIIGEPVFWLVTINAFREPDDWYGT